MTRIKICGVTNVNDALQAAELGADAVGLNFVNGSPRRITMEKGFEIVRHLPPFIEPVGVFVNDNAEQIKKKMARLGLRTYQWLGRRDGPPFQFTLNDFRAYFLERRPGGMSVFCSDMPEMRDDQTVARMIATLDAMSDEERRDPGLITQLRQEQIAQKCHSTLDEVKHLLGRFDKGRVLMVGIDSVGRLNSTDPGTLAPVALHPLRQWRVFGVSGKQSLLEIASYLEGSKSQGQLPDAILVDAHVPGSHGGTGQTLPWELLADFSLRVPLILAGGLTPDNVARAMRLVRPYAVDVASGVESASGKKDVDKMERFISAVKLVR